MPSAMDLMSSSLTLQPNLFQEFQPMGGVSARPLSSAVAGLAKERNARRARKETAKLAVNAFIGVRMHASRAEKSASDDTSRERGKQSGRSGRKLARCGPLGL